LLDKITASIADSLFVFVRERYFALTANLKMMLYKRLKTSKRHTYYIQLLFGSKGFRFTNIVANPTRNALCIDKQYFGMVVAVMQGMSRAKLHAITAIIATLKGYGFVLSEAKSPLDSLSRY
jgi:hypothetical protein